MLRKAKQDDSELLVGLLPFQVSEKKWEHLHQSICMLPFLVVVFVYFFGRPRAVSLLLQI